VHVVALRYATDDPAHPAEDAVCWWGDVPFGAHAARLLTIRRIDAQLHFSPTATREPSRAQMADRLHALLTRHHLEAGAPPSAPATS
jgi:hypothetical protein